MGNDGANLYVRLGKATPGRSAGPIRNQAMLDEGRPDLVVAFPGHHGTADIVRRARAAGIKVRQPGFETA